mmetsp:Transcript_31420/g.73705  ORF Transcript_31420/g.73705 Transcript_31420/m.73705 type:complete len:301 (+) Transcript_31420:1-903(+)
MRLVFYLHYSMHCALQRHYATLLQLLHAHSQDPVVLFRRWCRGLEAAEHRARRRHKFPFQRLERETLHVVQLNRALDRDQCAAWLQKARGYRLVVSAACHRHPVHLPILLKLDLEPLNLCHEATEHLVGTCWPELAKRRQQQGEVRPPHSPNRLLPPNWRSQHRVEQCVHRRFAWHQLHCVNAQRRGFVLAQCPVSHPSRSHRHCVQRTLRLAPGACHIVFGAEVVRFGGGGEEGCELGHSFGEGDGWRPNELRERQVGHLPVLLFFLHDPPSPPLHLRRSQPFAYQPQLVRLPSLRLLH